MLLSICTPVLATGSFYCIAITLAGTQVQVSDSIHAAQYKTVQHNIPTACIHSAAMRAASRYAAKLDKHLMHAFLFPYATTLVHDTASNRHFDTDQCRVKDA